MAATATRYLSRLRLALTGLVVAHHAAITYGGSGGWFYRERPVSGQAGSIALTLLNSVDQAFFMGLFFFIAGVLTPASLDRKGPWRYGVDRLLRLGPALAVFGAVLGPMTIALAATARGQPFLDTWWARLGSWEPGPLWFVQALLLFALGAALWQAVRGVPAATPLPAARSWWLSALGVGAVAWGLRLLWPVGWSWQGMQWGYFASYVFLFGLGLRAGRGGWLAQLDACPVRRWRRIAWLTLPVLPLTGLALGALRGATLPFEGGRNLPALVYAFWEPFLAWGLIAALLQHFQRRHNAPSPRWDALGDQAFAAFVLHAPVLVGTSLLLRGWGAPALLKWAVATVLAFAASLALGALLRQTAVLRRVF